MRRGCCARLPSCAQASSSAAPTRSITTVRWRRFGNTWVGAFLRYDSLAGAVFEDSPLVRSKHAVTAGVGISWVFARSSELVTTTD